MSAAIDTKNNYKRSIKARNMSRTRFPSRKSRGVSPKRASEIAIDTRPKPRKTRSNPIASLFFLSLIVGLAIFALTLGGFGSTAHSATLAPISLEENTFETPESPIVETISLQNSHNIDNMDITLGDLFQGLNESQSNIVVAHANTAGESLTYNYHHLNIIATRYNIDWQAFSESDHVTITRASNEITTAEIEETIRQALREEGAGNNFDLQFTSAIDTINLPTNTEASLAVENLYLDEQRNQFSATLRAPATGIALIHSAVSGRIYEIVEIPVLATRMRQGEIITATDIIWQNHRADNVSSNTLMTEAELLNMTPRHSINAGAIIRDNDLIEPILVARSDIITMTLNTGRISLTTRGRALNSGSMGDTIRVTNLSSNRTIEATVTGEGSAVVQ